MPVKVYISGISGNKEVKKRQQRVMMILDSKSVEYEVIDITEPGKEDDREFMQTMSASKDESRYPLPPQIFNEEDYCGDYEDFDLSNEMDELDKFLKLIVDPDVAETNSVETKNVQQNGNASREASAEKDASAVHSESELDERPSPTFEGEDSKDEEKPKATESESGTRETADELDSEQIEDDSTERNEEKSDDQEQEE